VRVLRQEETSRPTLANAHATALGLVLGYGVDALLGDPRRGHPVAAFGRAAAWLERRTYAPNHGAGVGHVGLLVGGAALLGLAAERLTRTPVVRVVVTAAATWAVLGGRSLRREAQLLATQLEADDLAAARVQVTHLVGRDPSHLDADEIARACVESVAENTSDAVVAPLLWGAVAGVPGLLAYRAANTLDAMVGHRSERYLRFGWAAARLDDVLNLAPARLAGLLAALAAPLVGGSPAAALAAVRGDAGRHPSPNAGVVEAAFAGALGVRLGGVNVYEGHAEDRGTLGDGRPVEVADIVRTIRLARAISAASLAVSVGLAALARRFLDTRWRPNPTLSVRPAYAGHRVSRSRQARS
jgi:adenosylcobinamide-phosphate synthase